MEPPRGMGVHFRPHHRRDHFAGEDEWEKSMDAIGIANSAGQRIRKELANTLLEECDNILRS